MALGWVITVHCLLAVLPQCWRSARRLQQLRLKGTRPWCSLPSRTSTPGGRWAPFFVGACARVMLTILLARLLDTSDVSPRHRAGLALQLCAPVRLAAMPIARGQYLMHAIYRMGPVMTAYTYYRGVSEATLGAVRGVGAIFGISATFVFPYLEKR